jgi:hypothetical protein
MWKIANLLFSGKILTRVSGAATALAILGCLTPSPAQALVRSCFTGSFCLRYSGTPNDLDRVTFDINTSVSDIVPARNRGKFPGAILEATYRCIGDSGFCAQAGVAQGATLIFSSGDLVSTRVEGGGVQYAAKLFDEESNFLNLLLRVPSGNPSSLSPLGNNEATQVEIATFLNDSVPPDPSGAFLPLETVTKISQSATTPEPTTTLGMLLSVIAASVTLSARRSSHSK